LLYYQNEPVMSLNQLINLLLLSDFGKKK
jgi:hypothetical protein